MFEPMNENEPEKRSPAEQALARQAAHIVAAVRKSGRSSMMPDNLIILTELQHRAIELYELLWEPHAGSPLAKLDMIAANQMISRGMVLPATGMNGSGPVSEPAAERSNIANHVLVALLWLMVFVLPMLAFDPDLSSRGQLVLTGEEAVLIAFATVYTANFLSKRK
jgi:hypothetical protein